MGGDGKVAGDWRPERRAPVMVPAGRHQRPSGASDPFAFSLLPAQGVLLRNPGVVRIPGLCSCWFWNPGLSRADALLLFSTPVWAQKVAVRADLREGWASPLPCLRLGSSPAPGRARTGAGRTGNREQVSIDLPPSLPSGHPGGAWWWSQPRTCQGKREDGSAGGRLKR